MTETEKEYIQKEQLKLARQVALEVIRDCSAAIKKQLNNKFEELIKESSK
tara:strand:- start:137 stop:286 length:150 start_codon:yes stop_codon:yes gene_type:complete